MRTGTGTGNGKWETGNGKQGTEEGKMRTKPFLIPYPQTIKSPRCRFSTLICCHILLCFPFLRDHSSFPVPDFPFLVLDILQVPPLIT